MTDYEEQWRKAGRVSGCADLRDVRLFGMSGDLSTPDPSASLAYTLDVDVEFQTLGDDPVHALVVTANYDLNVTETDESDDQEPTKVAGMAFALAAMYVLVEQDGDDPHVFENEELEAFAATTGQLALYPYAREFIADITGRMGLPPLHLGTLRFDRESGRN
ncbi:hypothetical protein GHK92_03015 [Nocardioides sp. dk4132]|uniref:protein-export chaperone SecB n=1 Tax=unclassified Nocardioides TaxID=2615069 RepID=UPI00129718F4|nr:MULTISPECIES: protein-export chaperone SecB [unclassified Nocardioides]MQW74832.1 hypothetical protein [Nocardioides sp. dk4132]QGA06720.1 hypothetical protein GFH29_04455 [Nocardioides sp. dk884]